MSISRGKRTFSTIFYSRITLVLILIVSCVLAMSVYERFMIERQMAERRQGAESELVELRARRTELEEKVQYLSNDEGIEAEIRTHFDVAREGEQVVIIVDDEGSSKAAVQPARVQETPDEDGFWARLLPW